MQKTFLFYDVDGWCWHRRCLGIQKFAPAEYDVRCFKESQRKSVDASGSRVLSMAWSVKPRAYMADKAWGLVANQSVQFPVNPSSPSFRKRSATPSQNVVRASAFLPQFDGLICINEEAREFCESLNHNTVYLRTGVDDTLFRPTAPINIDGPLRIAWCGKRSTAEKFSPKGFSEILTPLMMRLVELNIVWRINDRDSVNALNAEEMRDFYNSADLFLVTSSHEGTPSTALEAMACGRGVIGTAVGILPEVAHAYPEIGNPTRLSPTYDDYPESFDSLTYLETWIRKMYRERDEVAKLGAVARAVVERGFSWRDLSKVWLQTIHEER